MVVVGSTNNGWREYALFVFAYDCMTEDPGLRPQSPPYARRYGRASASST